MAVILQVPTNTTVLPNPNPDFSNVEQNLSTMTVLRSKTGKRFTYVKRRDRKRLVWNFQLTRQKAWELRAFIEAYRNQVMTITDFESVKWTGVLKSNPVEFTSSGRDAIMKEAVDVTLEFEATRLTPISYDLKTADTVTVSEATHVADLFLLTEDGSEMLYEDGDNIMY